MIWNPFNEESGHVLVIVESRLHKCMIKPLCSKKRKHDNLQHFIRRYSPIEYFHPHSYLHLHVPFQDYPTLAVVVHGVTRFLFYISRVTRYLPSCHDINFQCPVYWNKSIELTCIFQSYHFLHAVFCYCHLHVWANSLPPA